MQLNHLITSDYFDWKDHLKYHGLLIIVGSLCFSIILGLGKESHHDEAFKTFIFVYLMSCVFTSILMIPYSLVMILLHRFLRIKFYITLLLHIIFTIILTSITMQSMGIAKFGGIAFGFTGIILLCIRFRKTVKHSASNLE